jgi:hypothetical protein
VCQRLPELRERLSCYAAQFDAALLSAADARTVLGHAAAIEHLAATIKALAAARIADTGADPGERSAAHEVARATGTSIGSARQSLEIGRRLGDQPEVAAAARRGELSSSQLSAITGAAAADPTAAERLLGRANSTSLSELQDDCARTKAAARPDLEARRKHIHDHRRARSWTDTDGVWQFRAMGNPEEGAQVDVALAQFADQFFHAARLRGDREPLEAYTFDALIQLGMEAMGHDPDEFTEADWAGSGGSPRPRAGGRRDFDATEGPEPGGAGSGPAVTTPAGGRRRRGAPVKLLLRVDYDAWLRGVSAPGETCELVGYGPVAVSVVRDLLDTRDAFVAAILTKAHAVAGVAHLGRRPNAYQQSALEWLYPSCAAEGCAARAHLQTDHRADWASTHFTALDLLDRLCSHHHNLKTRQNWALVNGHGKRAFVAPDDPRHPRHQPPSRRPAAAEP